MSRRHESNCHKTLLGRGGFCFKAGMLRDDQSCLILEQDPALDNTKGSGVLAGTSP